MNNFSSLEALDVQNVPITVEDRLKNALQNSCQPIKGHIYMTKEQLYFLKVHFMHKKLDKWKNPNRDKLADLTNYRS